MTRQPSIFVPHGGGPWPWIPSMAASMQALRSYLQGLIGEPAPHAILMISAHWEAPVPTLMTSAAPPMLYDYGGFPPETYRVRWPGPGAPELAERVRQRLSEAGIDSGADAERGFDHGTFVVTAVANPSADIPTLQLSLIRGLDPREHLALGRALAPLRDEGVLIVGSGMSYHNMRGFQRVMSRMAGQGGAAVVDDSRAFHAWLVENVSAAPSDRERALVEWEQAPRARACHPREEHLLPLMVVAGAAGEDPARIPFRGDVLGVETCAVEFGDV